MFTSKLGTENLERERDKVFNSWWIILIYSIFDFSFRIPKLWFGQKLEESSFYHIFKGESNVLFLSFSMMSIKSVHF